MEIKFKIDKYLIISSLPISTASAIFSIWSGEIIFVQLAYVFLALNFVHCFAMGYITFEKKIFKTKKQKKIDELTKVGTDGGISENYARISAECCVNKTNMDIPNTRDLKQENKKQVP